MSQNCHLSISNLSRDVLLFVTLNFRSDLLRFYGNSVGAHSKTLQDPRKKKPVTFKDCILVINGSNINDFQALKHVFPSRWFYPTFACPLRAAKCFFKFRALFLKEISWDENYPYILIKQGPYWIVIAKEDWLLCFRSNTITLNIVKFWPGP